MIARGGGYDYDEPKNNREKRGDGFLGYREYSDELFLIDFIF